MNELISWRGVRRLPKSSIDESIFNERGEGPFSSEEELAIRLNGYRLGEHGQGELNIVTLLCYIWRLNQERLKQGSWVSF